MMNKNVKLIGNALSLRNPQQQSLELFAKLCEQLTLKKNVNLEDESLKVKALFPTFSSFERSFPSVCFALATGIGKTRLMGALMAYLYYEKGIKNFFVMAPNLTIYRKLRNDFGNVGSPKYVFKGLDAFVQAPRIIDGDNYGEFRNQTLTGTTAPITINVFNISKWNTESKGKDGVIPRTMRLNELLGESYFEYLKSLPDLCLFMDESHHYRAEKSFNVINDLQPVLGVEVTATPKAQKGSTAIPFKNVIYEYSLAHALDDGKYVKVPTVVTRKDFDPAQYDETELEHIKLQDGLRLHIDTKAKLDVYGRTHDIKIIKPFVLIVARDTVHSKQIKDYITSNAFFNGYYKDKVIEINSNQKGMEKDENIELLESLEKPENKIEIVIHVNMLKEGWDVNNLYTIIPLRASASETLTEQTIGRGLRLPYGERTGDDDLDRLSIVSHDKFKEIVSLANDPNSLVRKQYFIDPTANPENDEKVTVQLTTRYEDEEKSSAVQLALDLPDSVTKSQEQKKAVGKLIADCAYKTIQDANKQVKNIAAVNEPTYKQVVVTSVIREVQRQMPELHIKEEDVRAVAEKAVEFSINSLTNRVIPIPRATVQAVREIKTGFTDFDLDTRNINYRPSDEDTLHGQELQDGGKSFDLDMSFAKIYESDTPENMIIGRIISHDNIDYSKCADLIYKLIEQLKAHLKSYLKDDEKVSQTLRQYRNDLAEMIYAQMNQHFYHEETKYKAAEMLPFSKIENSYGTRFASDKVHDFRTYTGPAKDIKEKIFTGFKKSCHTLYKFESNPERLFAIVLEDDVNVEKWMRPAARQFSLFYDTDSNSQYQPDFIVETADKIYMVEVKASNQLRDAVVLKKAQTGKEFCRAATEFDKLNGGKPWEYALVSHDRIETNYSFKHIIENKEVIQDQLF